jgi:hypothetical protein
MTLWRFFTTRYTDHLELQVADLKSQLALERQEVRRLTEALVPALQRHAQSVAFVNTRTHKATDIPDVRKSVHQIAKAEDQRSAHCSCGWREESDDPVELQQAISEHYKLAFPPVKAKRPSPSELIRNAEAQSLKESQKQRREA